MSTKLNQNNDVDEFVVVEDENGDSVILYDPHPQQLDFHHAEAKNLLDLGPRGTGKSVELRWDAILRCLATPNFHALIIRRTMPELRNSHLNFIEYEMKMLGGRFLHGTFVAEFPNGSKIFFRHCETEADIMNFLSAQYGFIGFDELSTFTLTQFLLISAVARAPKTAPYTAVVRACSNPLGVGAGWMEAWFVLHSVRREDYPDYWPEDFMCLRSTLEGNPSLDAAEYRRRLKNLPEHVRKAWLDGEFVIEGAYFADFRPLKELDGEIVDWHVVHEIPTWSDRFNIEQPAYKFAWMNVYRAVDWGYSPDPAVCLWFVILPNKRVVVFKEMQWNKTLAKDVAKDIKRASEGMKVVETFADPSMFIKSGQSVFSIADEFEQNGVPLTASIADREKYGYAIHDFLNTLIDDRPRLQIVAFDGYYGCKDLVRTLPLMRMDPKEPTKIADGEDHWVVALAYFCLGLAAASRDPYKPELPLWMRLRHARARAHHSRHARPFRRRR